MKTQTYFRSLLVITAFLLLGGKNTAQTLVKPEQINTENISNYLKNNNFEIGEITGDFLKVNKKGKTRNIFLDLKDQNRYIMFNIAYKVSSQADKENVNEFVKKLNEFNLIKVRYFENENNIQIEYYFWIKQGFTYESFLDALNEFYLYVGDCISADKDKIFE